MKIGFTGTQKGMNIYQKELFLSILSAVKDETNSFHHGDCIGADKEAHDLVDARIDRWLFKGVIVIHPPSDSKKRAFCTTTEIYMRKPKPYIERNKDIVNEIDILIACPKSPKEELRSGTWATIRYARKQGKPVFIL